MIYDYFISLGEDCSVAGALRNLKYKDMSYPFDWCVTKLTHVIDVFSGKSEKMYSRSANAKVKSTDNSVYYYHEPIYSEESVRGITSKYSRRTCRLFELCKEAQNNNKSVMFVRIGQYDRVEDLKSLKQLIIQKFPTLAFKILLINGICENSDDEQIIHISLENRYFLSYRDDVFKHQLEKDVVYRAIEQVIKEHKIKNIFEQPILRDNDI